MIDPARPLLLCLTTAELAVPYAPSDVAACVQCGTGVWVGRLSHDLTPDAQPVCDPCYRAVRTPNDVITVPRAVVDEAARVMKEGLS